MTRSAWYVVAVAVLTLWSRCLAQEDGEDMHKVYWKYQKYEAMVQIKGRQFLMGNSDPNLASSGEYPPRKLIVGDFSIDAYPVTNAQFWKYQTATRGAAATRARRAGFSYVLAPAVPGNSTAIFSSMALDAEPWWIAVRGAEWSRPEGPASNVSLRMRHPVVHVSHADAKAYCEWRQKRLPSEAEWEFAARAGLTGKPYPWGDGFQGNRTNLWQGLFPYENKALDGYRFVSPVDAFQPQNSYGLYDFIGNAWEWTATPARRRNSTPRGARLQYILKGGSFIDFREDKSHINHPARVSTRMRRPEDFSSQHIGFRCAKSPAAARPRTSLSIQPAPLKPRRDEL